MKHVFGMVIGFAILCSTVCAQQAADSPNGAAPKVLSTSPEAYVQDVDPALDKISVTFDQPMQDRSWSWTGGGETYPQLTGKPSYDDTQTICAMPVKLEPGKAYWVGINSPSHQNFKSADGQPARRYVILFATKSAEGKPTPIPQDMLKSAKQINGRPTPAPAAAKPGPDQQAATKASDAWLQLVDAEKYAEMWQALDPLAQTLTDEKTFTNQVSAVRTAMGKLTQRKFASAEQKTSLPGVPDGNYFILQYNSSFEKKKQAVETAVMARARR